MKTIILSLLLAAPLWLTGCGSCTPSPAYTTPAHWDGSYYSQESSFSHYRYYRSCGYHTHYSSYSSHFYQRYDCETRSEPVYHYYEQYHPAVYHPDQYHPAIVCAKKTS